MSLEVCNVSTATPCSRYRLSGCATRLPSRHTPQKANAQRTARMAWAWTWNKVRHACQRLPSQSPLTAPICTVNAPQLQKFVKFKCLRQLNKNSADSIAYVGTCQCKEQTFDYCGEYQRQPPRVVVGCFLNVWSEVQEGKLQGLELSEWSLDHSCVRSQHTSLREDLLFQIQSG